MFVESSPRRESKFLHHKMTCYKRHTIPSRFQYEYSVQRSPPLRIHGTLGCSVARWHYFLRNRYKVNISYINNLYHNIGRSDFTFPNLPLKLYNWMNNKILLNFALHEKACRMERFCQAKHNFWSYCYTVASIQASAYQLCSPFLQETDMFSNKVRLCTPA